jgi:hypothetical protein
MPVACPHCTKDVPNVVTQEDHVKRLKAKDDLIAEVKAELVTASAVAKDAPAVALERDQLRSKVQQLEEGAVRGTAFDKAKISAEPKVRDRFQRVYDSEMAGLADDKRVPFATWLEAAETKADPFLAPHFGSATTPAPGAPGAPATKVLTATPKVDAGAGDPPPTTQIKTQAELASYFESDEYRALEPKEQRRVSGDLRRQMLKGGTAKPAAVPTPATGAPRAPAVGAGGAPAA